MAAHPTRFARSIAAGPIRRISDKLTPRSPFTTWQADDRPIDGDRHGRLKLSFGWSPRIIAVRSRRLKA